MVKRYGMDGHLWQEREDGPVVTYKDYAVLHERLAEKETDLTALRRQLDGEQLLHRANVNRLKGELARAAELEAQLAAAEERAKKAEHILREVTDVFNRYARVDPDKKPGWVGDFVSDLRAALAAGEG